MSIPQENTQVSQEAPKNNDKEYNFAQMRKQLESERQARLQAEERAAELEKMSHKRDQDDDDDEPYVDNKKLNRTLASFERNMEKKIEEKAEQKARLLLEEERRNSWLRNNPDFNNVMSPDMLKKFAEEHADLAEDILSMPDSFERQKLVYRNIKKLGVDKPPQKQPTIQDKIDANKRSPYYQNSAVGGPGYSNGGDFSDSGIKNAYEKMQALKKQLRI